MVLYGTNRAPDGLHRIVESAQPRIKIDPAVAYHVDCFGLDSPLFHVSYHFVAVHVASTAIRMGNDHHFFYSQLDDGHQQTTDDTAERMGNDGTGILYNLYVSIVNSLSGGQQFCQAGIHTGKDGDFLIRILVSDILFVSPVLNELFVEFKNFF